uniref:E2F/DP family winged-helix DNA-binding domain-containing protein n=1 Tax=Leersia perrieri TaxID=77586 RepID=A0A0D9WNU1_9ORYZ
MAATAIPSSSAAPAADAPVHAEVAQLPAPPPRPAPYQPPRLAVDGAGGGAVAVVGGGKPCRHHAYSRKQKSLGLLCTNFVALYDRGDVEAIGLDDAAKRLGVERRRIYDIVNVLESVGILVRRAKNRYTWIGFGGVPAALRELKERALREVPVVGSPSLDETSAANVSDDEDDDKFDDADGDAESEKLSLSQSIDNSSDKPDAAPCKLRSDHRKEKSLGLLTQNFVKLFLTMEIETISLDEAAKRLLGEGHAENNMRTKVRRLYDIANVLSSLKLIEKTQQADSRKPAFRWLGQPKKNEGDSVTVAFAPTKMTLPSKRAFGTDLTNFDNKRGKLDSTMENRGNLTLGNRSDFVYGPFHPAGTRARKEHDNRKILEKDRKSIQDWENLASSFRPQYQNPALNDLFGHYVEAWSSWYSDLKRDAAS